MDLRGSCRKPQMGHPAYASSAMLARNEKADIITDTNDSPRAPKSRKHEVLVTELAYLAAFSRECRDAMT